MVYGNIYLPRGGKENVLSINIAETEVARLVTLLSTLPFLDMFTIH